MSGESGRKSIVIGLFFLAFAVAIILLSVLSPRSTRRAEMPLADSSAVDGKAQENTTDSGKIALQPGQTGPAVNSTKAKSGDAANADADAEKKKIDAQFDYGRTTPVKGDTNPQVKSVSEALRDKNHPERLSALIQPKPFDAEAYKKDPKTYLNTVEPGRCFQSAQPGEGVPQLRPLSPQFQNVAQGQSVTLKVKVAPKAPCSFTSLDLGKFQNELTAITVEADEQGVAETKFFGTPGTINEVNILAASPTSSGQARFMVNVTK